MMSEFRLFTISLLLTFLTSFGGAHLLTDLFAPLSRDAVDIVLLLAGLASR
jgi:hypothetical protein